MERILTAVPIPMNDLRRKFTEDVEFVIDYKNCKLKNTPLITYLTNLNIKVRLNLESVEDCLELIKEYLRMPKIAPLQDLDLVVINMLLCEAGRPHLLAFDPSEFLAANREIVDIWWTRLRQLPLFALYCHAATAELKVKSDEQGVETTIVRQYEEVISQMPIDDNTSLVGINYINLIKQPQFAELMLTVKPEQMTYNPVLFNHFIFGGNNLFHYFAVPENPLFIGSIANDEDMVAFEQALREEEALLDHTLETLNVPLIG